MACGTGVRYLAVPTSTYYWAGTIARPGTIAMPGTIAWPGTITCSRTYFSAKLVPGTPEVIKLRTKSALFDDF